MPPWRPCSFLIGAHLPARAADGDRSPVTDQPPARRAGGGASGSPVAEALGNAFRLSSDRNRHGQDAFTASPFSRLALTHVLSLGGDALVTLALAGSLFFSTPLHAARGRVALTLAITIAPFAIVAPLLGPIIDKTAGGRRAMVVATAVGRAVACLLMARYIKNGLGLYPAAFLSLVFSKGYTVAKATLVPSAVQRTEDLVEANSKLAVSGAVAGFLMAIPGVAILKLFDAAWLLRVDAFVFLACSVAAFRLQVIPPAKQADRRPSDLDQTDILGRPSVVATDPTWVDAAGPTRVDRPKSGARTGGVSDLPPGAIQVAAAAMGALRLIVGFLTFLVAFGFRQTKAPAWWYGIVLAGSIGGNLVGAGIAPWLRSRVREELILAGSTLAIAAGGIFALLFPALQSRPAAAILAGIVGLAAGAAKLAFDALVQRHIPAANQGRAFGRFEAGFQLVWVVGALVPVIIEMTLTEGFLFLTLTSLAAAIVYIAGTRMARFGRLPDWWPGVRPPTRRLPRPTALANGVGHSRGELGDPGPSESDPESPWAPDPHPGHRPPFDDQADPHVPFPWEDPPDLGTYPPKIDGPPPFGPAGPRPVPPPLSGPPPRDGPLHQPGAVPPNDPSPRRPAEPAAPVQAPDEARDTPTRHD